MRDVLAYFADLMLGPRCVYGCGFRGRGWRTLAAHVEIDHAGDPPP